MTKVYESKKGSDVVTVHEVNGRLLGKAVTALGTFTTGLLDTTGQVLRALAFRAKFGLSDEAATKARQNMRRDEE